MEPISFMTRKYSLVFFCIKSHCDVIVIISDADKSGGSFSSLLRSLLKLGYKYHPPFKSRTYVMEMGLQHQDMEIVQQFKFNDNTWMVTI